MTDTVLWLGLLAGAFFMGYPYIYMFGNSLKTRFEFASDKASVWPERVWAKVTTGDRLQGTGDSRQDRTAGPPAPPAGEWSLWKNYSDALTFGRVGIYLRNSFFYALVGTIVQLVFDLLAAYAFARMTFKGRDLLFGLVLSTMMLPPAVLLVPQFLVAKDLGMVDTFIGVIAPGAAGAFGIFMLRQFFMNIPVDLENAARIDGCSDFGILWRILVPLAKPALITLGLFIFLGTWNSFVWPLVILSDWNMYPLTVGLSLFREESTADWPRIFAASVMGSVPLVVLFLVAQRYLIGGIALSGMKG
jgi:multiple sugar transport system permease protein